MRENNITSKLIEQQISLGKHVAIFFRHSERFQSADVLTGNDVKLTQRGKVMAVELGKKFRNIKDINYFSSPIHRCVDTLQCFITGHGKIATIKNTRWLGDPGVYYDALSEEDCGKAMEKQGFMNYAIRYINEGRNVGARRLDLASEELLDYFKLTIKRGLTLYNSHDFLVASLMKHTGVKNPSHTDYVEYLEGMVLVTDKENREFKYFRFNPLIDNVMSTWND